MVSSSSGYVPERGDIVWLDFKPQLGHEQRGRRPALTISHRAYNEKVGLAHFCPITSTIKGYPFEV
ncbi:MAG TPA: type II toxin-antitoxin system PemK/MazF family toxin [Rectinema sp.]|nr:type II toxin-antitoxin system PemK/MazF family toxin [Rectinema sp.]HQL17306.1 type II toxin-antitoxin system PemK/MazF family toxin [Rectinema sp.]